MRGLHQSPSLIAVKTKWKLRSRRPFSVVRAQSRDEGGSDVAPSNFRVLARHGRVAHAGLATLPARLTFRPVLW